MSTKNMLSNSNPSVESMVFDFFNLVVESILQDRKAWIQPITSASQNIVEYPEYIRNTLQYWRTNLTKPMVLDLYLYVPKYNNHILLERWNFNYDINSDQKKEKIPSFQAISKRIILLVRSISCFVRLLPGFNWLPLSSQKPYLSFQIYDQKITPSNFKHETSRHSFPLTSVSKGFIAMTVTFLNSTYVKEIIKALNSSSKVSSAPIAISNSRRNSFQGSANIPIPKSFESQSGLRGYYSGDTFARSLDSKSGVNFDGPFLSPQNTMAPFFGTPPHNNMTLGSSLQRGISSLSIEKGFLPSSSPTQLNPQNPSAVSQQQAYTPSSSHSTPPFAYMPSNEVGSFEQTLADLQGPSPPFSQVSSSLNSCSPQFPYPGSERRNSSRRNSYNITPSNSLQNQSITEKGIISLQCKGKYADLKSKLKFSSTPYSLQNEKSSNNNNSSNSDQSGTTIEPSYSDQSNKLDFVIRYEKNKKSGKFQDIFVFDRIRSISGGSNADDVDQQRMSDLTNLASMDEDLPFAWAPNDISTSLLSKPMPSTQQYSISTLNRELFSQIEDFKQFSYQLQRSIK